MVIMVWSPLLHNYAMMIVTAVSLYPGAGEHVKPVPGITRASFAGALTYVLMSAMLAVASKVLIA
jgi:hypothetical protein